MPRYIHARRRKKGIVYRIWSTITDAYETGPVNTDQLRLMLLFQGVTEELWGLRRELPGRIARAQTKGTSEYDDTQNLEGPWEKQVRIGELPDWIRQQYLSEKSKCREDLVELLAHWDELV